MKRAILLLLVALASTTCGKSPTGPSSSLTVRTVSPNSGSTLGGTLVTITGTKFAADATVTIGGAAATNVTVQGETTLTATTPQHASGAADVVVSAGGRSGSLAGGFTFVAPGQSSNTPPVIASITAKGTRRNEPSQFADVNETINVTAFVSDAETPLDQLEYQWTAPGGAFIGGGPAVKWQAPGGASTPVNYDLTLTIIERYQSTDNSGLPVTKENRTTQSVSVSLHNSAREVGDMAVQFLEDFSNQISPDTMLRNFLDCSGRSSERNDIIDNQSKWTIKRHRVDGASVRVNFGGTCEYRDRAGDACIDVPVDWHSVSKSNPAVGEHAYGTDRLSGFYQNSRWWLCDSDFDGLKVPETPVTATMTRVQAGTH